MAVKMYWEGIGPKLVLVTLPYIILVIAVMIFYPDFLKMAFLSQIPAFIIASAWGLIGIIFYALTAVTFFRGFYKNRLLTTGTYALSRNPIYATFIVFIVPALGICFRSWLLMSVIVPLYINFKILIKEEYSALLENFGKEFLDYTARVNEIIPIPKFWKR